MTCRSPWAFLRAAWGRGWKCRREGGRLSSARKPKRTIREDFRQLICRLCHKEVVICSHGDRGQCYCSEECSEHARRESLLEAGRQYQQTPYGRAKHAARQALYLLRQSMSWEKDDASGYPDAEQLVHTVSEDAEEALGEAVGREEPAHWAHSGMRCCLCGALCLLRRDVSLLRRRR